MAVAFLNSNTAISNAGPTATLTGAMTVNADSNLCAWVDVSWDDVNEGITISSATYNGIALTSLGARVRMGATANRYLQSFVLANNQVATGSNTLTVNFTPNADATNMAAMLRAYKNVDQTTPIRAATYTSFSGQTDAAGLKAFPVTTATDDLTVTAVVENANSPTTDQTLRTADAFFATFFLGTDDGAGASPVTHTWNTNIASVNDIALTGASLQAVSTTTDPGGPSVTIYRPRLRVY